MTMMDTIVREGKTERRIRALDAGDIVQEIHGLEDERDALAARLAEAVAAIEGLLNALPSATTHPAIIAARKVVAAQESDDAQR